MNRRSTLGLWLALACCAYAQVPVRRPTTPEKVFEVDQTCMNCLCHASSGCDETLKCHNAGGSSYFCGPYVISWAYWHDGGRPGDKGRAHDFETCLSNKTCAEQAVRGYMRKYGQDCDKSGSIDCYDFARIHKLGFGSCGDDAIFDTTYWENFENCYNGYPSYPGNGNANANGDNGAVFPNYDYGESSIQARRGLA